MAFVIINHGLNNVRPEGHWQRYLALELRRRGHQVFYPQYPSSAEPKFADWSWLLARELELLVETKGDSDGEIIVVGHSLGNVNFVKAAAEGLLPEGFVADRYLAVAPPDPVMIDKLPDFGLDLAAPRTREALHSVARSITLLGSDADPWSPRGVQVAVGDPLGLTAQIIPGAAHFARLDGWGKWQGVIDWIEDPKADLSKR
jgi:predicted alpha/beta hydrolase family esterase